MVEIYSYDVTTHERFARDQQEIEAFRRQYHIPPSGARLITQQAKVLDFIPKHPAIVLLLQTYQRKTWARFAVPKNYHNQRFLSSYVAPSLGPREKQDADIQKLEAMMKKRKRVDRKEERGDERERRREKDEEFSDEADAIVTLIKSGVKETNDMVDFVVSRMHQFVQA